MKHEIVEYEERYFVGYAVKVKPGTEPNPIPELWNKFMSEGVLKLDEFDKEDNFIGLEMYPYDFMDTKEFYYHAMVQTKEKLNIDGFETIVLRKGKYILFSIEFDNIFNDIQACYKYIKENHVNINHAFDYEGYISGENYSQKGAKLHFAFLLES